MQMLYGERFATLDLRVVLRATCILHCAMEYSAKSRPISTDFGPMLAKIRRRSVECGCIRLVQQKLGHVQTVAGNVFT